MEVGTWVLKPEYYKGNDMKTAAGSIGVKIDAEGTSGALKYAGTGTQRIEIIGFEMGEIILRLLPYILITLFILWFVIGHLIKKRIPTHGLNPRCEFKDTLSPKRKIKKSFFSVILPYVPERAVIHCRDSRFQCNCPNLEIVANGGRSFKITNKNKLPLESSEFCGVVYENMEAIKKKPFSITGFYITSIDPKKKRELGTYRTKHPIKK